MSVFGQVWVFSAVAFVLGALLAWLFLVRPAQKRIAELQRRLAAKENAPRSRASAERTRVAPPVKESDSDKDRTTTTPPPTRRFEPAAEPPGEARDVTEHLAPAPSWPESDSLRGRESGPKSEIDELDEDFARLDALEELQGSTGEVLGDPTAPESDAPTLVHGSHGGQLDLGADERGADQHDDSGASRRGSLFQPQSYDEPEPEPPAPGFGEEPAGHDAEPRNERASALPKRQPGRTQMESFEPAKPIQTSMRPVVERRDPLQRRERAGSLFEPNVSPSNSAPPARDTTTPSSLPPGPFGPGSAMPKPGGGRPSEEFTVKASVTALRYCTEESPEYPRMVAEVWFRTPADAERVGFRPL